MGLLIDGRWQDGWYDTKQSGGHFVRKESAFRHWVTPDGSAGPTGRAGFAAAPGRYHLYVAYACPWAHRTLIMRALKGLEAMISVSVTHWLMLEHGWTFEAGPGVIADPHLNARFLHQVYTAADAHYSGRVTVPVLWDKQTSSIVNNESADILRMFNTAFDELGARPGDYYPAALRGEIDSINARVYETVNNGVYRAGFATAQAAYEEAVQPLFETLGWLDARLASQRYLLGGRLTEADLRLLPTLLRFDSVYYSHFKCNLRQLRDYKHLSAYMRDLYQLEGIAGTFNLEHAKRHYYESQRSINPTGIYPVGPHVDFESPPARDHLASAVRR